MDLVKDSIIIRVLLQAYPLGLKSGLKCLCQASFHVDVSAITVLGEPVLKLEQQVLNKEII